MKTKTTLFIGALITIALNTSSFTYSQVDFGDAPDPTYPTLSMNNGAQHVVGPFFLGANIDVEIDGQPVINATGDDYSGQIDDEDGLLFTTWLVPGQIANVTVTASLNGFLEGWIDFQANGNWTDPGDQIFTSLFINPGQNNLTFNVPAGAIPGTYTYGRFRFSSVPGIPFTGLAPDGEVEDYHVIIGTPQVGDVVVDIDAGLSFAQNEISLTQIPTTGRLVAAYNDNPYPGGPGIGISYSSDNGQTWTSQQLAIPNNPISGVPYLDTFDPTITSDMNGNVYVAYIATDANWAVGPVSGLYVTKSTDGGVSWNTPFPVDVEAAPSIVPDPNYRFNDRCQITVDNNPGSPNQNNIYLTWIKDRGWGSPQPWSDIYISVSTDSGVNFSTASMINNINNAFGNMPVPDVTSNGDLYILWMDYNVVTGGNGTMFYNISSDGGSSWATDTAINTIPLPPLYLNGGTDVQAKGAAIIRTHPTNTNELYVVYASDPDAAGPDEADIFFTKTTNAGGNWSTAIRINDDSTTNDQVLPWMEVSPNGIINIVWYDRRNDSNDLLWDIYSTTSIDGGNSFQPNTQVNNLSFATPQPKNGFWFGEYLALENNNNEAYVIFTSSVIDIQGDIFFSSFNNPVLGVDEFASEEFLLYPNPTYGSITVQTRNTENAHLNIYDIFGKLIHQQKISEKTFEVNVESLQTGIYFVRLIDIHGAQTKKLIKY